MALEDGQRAALEAGRRAVSRLKHALDRKSSEANPNSRRLAESLGMVDTPEAQRSREASREFVARAEAGQAVDTTEYARRKIEEMRRRV